MKSRFNHTWAGVGLLLVMTLAVYAPALNGIFVWDDDDYVSENPTLRDVGGLADIWFHVGATPQYYPLTFTSFWIEYYIWQDDARGYHLVNILLHAVNSVLFWFLLRRLALPGAWLAAAIFALHPVHVESVAWITERKNVLSGAFYLASLLAYFRFRPLNGNHKAAARHYVAALVFFLFSLLSKTAGATLPAAILLVVWWKRGRLSRTDVMPTVPFFILAMGMGFVTAWTETHAVGAQGETWPFTFLERGLIAGRALWFYFAKLLCPVGLAFIYPRWTVDSAIWWQYLFPIGAVVLVLVLWFVRKRLGSGPLVAALYFGGTLLPALGFINIYFMQFSFIADHFQYLASLGPIALFAALLIAGLNSRDRLRRGGVRTGLIVILLGTLGTLGWHRSALFRNLDVLWADTLARNPDCWMAHNNLAVLLEKRGDDSGAEGYYAESLRSNPEDATIQNNYAALLARSGRVEEALVHLSEARRIAPELADTYFNLGNIREQQGRLADAAEQYKEALRRKPTYKDALFNLANVLSRQRAFSEALPYFQHALRLDPESQAVRVNLGNAYASLGRLTDAQAEYAEVIRAAPDHALAHKNLAFVLRASGRSAQAVPHLTTALRLRPDWHDVARDLAWILATHGDAAVRDGGEAVRIASRLCEATGRRDPGALDALAAAYAEVGQFEQAVGVAREAVGLATNLQNASLAEGIRARIELYESDKPARFAD